MSFFDSARVRAFGAVALFALAPLVASCSNPFKPSQNVNVPFSVTDTVVGTAPEVVPFSTVQVEYAGYLYDASKPNNEGLLIATSLAGQPLVFLVGGGQVIPGLEQGMLGMKLGGHRIITIPPELAYGPFEHYPVPKNATLVYEVDLRAILLPAQQ